MSDNRAKATASNFNGKTENEIAPAVTEGEVEGEGVMRGVSGRDTPTCHAASSVLDGSVGNQWSAECGRSGPNP